MTETKECPNCGKRMIKWFNTVSNPEKLVWKCSCDYEEIISQEENKDEKS